MEFNQILELIDHVSASELTAFTYETADLTLSMEHGKPQVIQGVMGETVENIPAAGMAGGKDATETQAVNTASAQSTEQSKPAPQKSDDQTGSLVTSPLVGPFYAAPSQDLPPYVQVGDKVKISEFLSATNYSYIIEPAVAMSGCYRNADRIKSKEGIIKSIEHTPRGFIVTAEFDE